MRWGRLATENHRGILVPRTLGLVLALAAAVSSVAYALVREVARGAWGALAASLLVCAAGLVDDLAPPGPRGLRDHLRALGSGRVSTGIVKLLVTLGSAVVAVALAPGRPGGIQLAGVVLVAACANVCNGLDVRPGRAIKGFLLPAASFLALGELALVPELLGLTLAAVLVLPLDLRERAMLGDSGSNLLGFSAGLGLYAICSDAAVVVGAVVVVALNVVADTVSFSRVIEATPPLRWLDGLGRVRGTR